MRWLPRTLYGQLLVTLLLGLLLANAVGIALVLNDRDRLTRTLRAEYVAQHLADVINLLDEVPASSRAKMVGALSSPAAQVSIDHHWIRSEESGKTETLVFCQLIRENLEYPFAVQVLSFREDSPEVARDVMRPYSDPSRYFYLPGKQLLVDVLPRSDGDNEPESEFKVQLATVQAQLRDGTVVTFRVGQVATPEEPPWRVTAWLFLVALVAAVLSAWAVRRLTRPLAVFSQAASGLATNLDQPPLPETGTVEVANSSRAFNRMQKELQRYVKNRSQILAGVSHDMRLPITRIRLRLEQLPDGKHKQAIERDLGEMDQLIGDTLAYLRGGTSGEVSVLLHIDALLEGAIEDVEAMGGVVRLNSEPVKPLQVKPQSMRRCVGNLLENARRYGGDKMDVRLREHNGQLSLLVRDYGPGIAEGDIERVFEPYVRLESSRARHTGGSGLGLAIARAIARDHGGDILLYNHPMGGLCAMLTIPVRR
ncbi:sensor protein [Xenophilus sp. AP218F]|nr:ATP-binding protein [Chromobacterium sp. ASV5]OWY39515.1 sensor protein [Xenophilus sp. AP218F]